MLNAMEDALIIVAVAVVAAVEDNGSVVEATSGASVIYKGLPRLVWVEGEVKVCATPG